MKLDVDLGAGELAQRGQEVVLEARAGTGRRPGPWPGPAPRSPCSRPRAWSGWSCAGSPHRACARRGPNSSTSSSAFSGVASVPASSPTAPSSTCIVGRQLHGPLVPTDAGHGLGEGGHRVVGVPHRPVAGVAAWRSAASRPCPSRRPRSGRAGGRAPSWRSRRPRRRRRCSPRTTPAAPRPAVRRPCGRRPPRRR